ncbi:transglycosylase SLT domain-containing protein [Pseudomonas sp.]|jgi:hypothetical protein|uniref:transglycosylase SLT domain-containing protein n=1 Tax=Pseudomonas sp. TaxID=306 RepID=UPI002EDADC05
MALNSDNDGFLVGSPASVDLAGYARQLDLLRSIDHGIAQLNRTLADSGRGSKGGSSSAPSSPASARSPRTSSTASRRGSTPSPVPPPLPVATPRRRVEPSTSSATSSTSTRGTGTPARRDAIPHRREQALPTRGSNGRFQPRNGAADNGRNGGGAAGPGHNNPTTPDDPDSGSSRGGSGRLSNAINGLKNGLSNLSGLAHNTENIDPTIAAAKEVKESIGPLFRPLAGLFGRGGTSAEEKAERKVAVPWYRRIWGELRESNKKDGGGRGLFATLLAAIVALPGLLMGGLGKILGGIFKAIPGAGLVGSLAKGGIRAVGAAASGAAAVGRKIFGRKKSPGVEVNTGGASAGSGGGSAGNARKTGRMGKIGSALGKAGKAVGKVGGAVLKRVPLLGTLINAGMGVAKVMDPDASKQEKFEGGGSAVGSVVGAAIGSLAGPLGTIVGGMIGDKVGSMVGGWLSTLDWSDIGKQISGAWDGVVSVFSGAGKLASDAASSVFKTVSEAASSLGSMVSDVYKSVKDWFGDKLGGAVDGAKELASKAVDVAASAATAVTGTAKTAYTAAKGVASNMASKASTAYSNVKDAAVVQGGRIMGALDKGYRHKESFDGIKGGSSLADNGSYTNDEASRIRDLKQGGYNTSANLPGGMSASTQKKIEAAASQSGLDPKMMLSMAAMESGGNPNAISSTGAIGTFQFTGRTASGVGITNRFDEDQNIAGGMKLAQVNQQYLQMRGLPVTPENLYMMHQLGPSAAEEMILGAKSGKNINELSAGTQKAVGLNYGKGSTTAAEYLGKNAQALNDRYNKVVGGSAGTGATAAASASAGVPAVATAPSAADNIPITLRPMAAAKPSIPAASNAAPSIAAKAPGVPTVPPERISTDKKETTGVMRLDQPVGQDVGERQIAALVTGGIGNGGQA